MSEIPIELKARKEYEELRFIAERKKRRALDLEEVAKIEKRKLPEFKKLKELMSETKQNNIYA